MMKEMREEIRLLVSSLSHVYFYLKCRAVHCPADERAAYERAAYSLLYLCLLFSFDFSLHLIITLLLFFSQKCQKINSVPVGNLFPMNTQEDILNFLDDSDGLFKARENGFFELLFLIRTDCPKQFGDSLLSQLFTKEYQASHHWPSIL